LPIRELTSVRIFAPGAFSFEHAARPLLELAFDGERSGGRADLRPVLPLVLLW
jgi:hypothetical protein